MGPRSRDGLVVSRRLAGVKVLAILTWLRTQHD